jgi:hypothetical protein
MRPSGRTTAGLLSEIRVPVDEHNTVLCMQRPRGTFATRAFRGGKHAGHIVALADPEHALPTQTGQRARVSRHTLAHCRIIADSNNWRKAGAKAHAGLPPVLVPLTAI